LSSASAEEVEGGDCAFPRLLSAWFSVLYFA
jgi:hypothetical protein